VCLRRFGFVLITPSKAGGRSYIAVRDVSGERLLLKDVIFFKSSAPVCKSSEK
jgi:hypothetical protein